MKLLAEIRAFGHFGGIDGLKKVFVTCIKFAVARPADKAIVPSARAGGSRQEDRAPQHTLLKRHSATSLYVWQQSYCGRALINERG